MDRLEWYKRILVLVLLTFSITENIHCITIREKIVVNKKISMVQSLIYSGQLSNAKKELTQIKYAHANSEFYTIANFLLAKISHIENDSFTAQFYIELALEGVEDPRLSVSKREDIVKTAAIIYHRTGNKDESINMFDNLLTSDSASTRSFARVYLALFAFEDDDLERAYFHFGTVDRKLLHDREQEIYDYLYNFVGWSKIDTATMGYRDPNISCLYAKNDTLYIGLWNGGVISYNYLLDYHNFYRAPVLSSDEIRAIVADDTRVWIGTNDGISIINRRDDSVSSPEKFARLQVTALEADNDFIYIGTLANGLLRYNKRSNVLEQIIENENICTIYKMEDKLLFATYNSCLYSLENGKIKQLTRFGHRLTSPILGIRENSTQICFITYGSGIILYDKSSKKITTINSKTNSVLVNDHFLTLEVNDDVFYCGTLGNGVYCLSGDTLTTFPISDVYFINDIQKILYHQGCLFFGTLGEGVLMKRIDSSY